MEFLNIAYISRVNIASLNGSEGSGGNITPIKKISDSQGNDYAYVSGQALRRYFKETLMQLGKRITAVNENGEPDFLELNEKIYNKGKTDFQNVQLMYQEFCDLDLFGYMLPKGNRRWSPVKVAPMVSLHPYKGEYDYLTRKKKREGERTGNIVQVEIDTLNFMRGNLMVDIDKVGCEINEYTYERVPMLEGEKIKERLSALIDSIKFLNGGAKQSRNLEDISPKFVAAVRQKTGNPFLLNAIKVTGEDELDASLIIEALQANMPIIAKVKIGLTSGIFKNTEGVKEQFINAGFEVWSVAEALDSLKEG